MDKCKGKLIYKKLSVFGIVQGIGFRPFVARTALKYGVLGTVRNLGGFVEIKLCCDEYAFRAFFVEISNAECIGGYIVKIDVEEIVPQEFTHFEIIMSDSSTDNSLIMLPNDLPVCDVCKDEIKDKTNRRYLHPFNSCISCGPRYSIIEAVPYDRQNTTMSEFPLCRACEKEYKEQGNRRYHAQTVSCNECGPYLIYSDSSGESIKEAAFEKAVLALKNGEIIAIKGIGGYHFACSPFRESSVKNLRALKERDTKPFAVMFPSLEEIKKYCTANEAEESLLISLAHPIVLLNIHTDKFAYSVKGNLLNCGCFLPYTPLQEMLLKITGPLIMTSANISESPIIKDDEELLKIKSSFLSGVLYNKRKITRRVEDSVARMIGGRTQIIRRSRGFVPLPVPLKSKCSVFAAGGDLKASFCISNKQFAYLSEYFGDLENSSVFNLYAGAIDDFIKLFNITPAVAVFDMHPKYCSLKTKNKLSIPSVSVQHHHAHIASVMAEHKLDTPVIGVAFDGTGYGTDGNIWGGEFLVCEGARFSRAAHLEYMKIIGGDNSSKDAKKTAFCYLYQTGIDHFIKDASYPLIKAALENNINTALTSSMGRLFDVVAALLDTRSYNSYEGECAISLEHLALTAKKAAVLPYKLQFDYVSDTIVMCNLLSDICTALANGADRKAIALGFHYAVSDMILSVCETIRAKTSINDIALSGGVFQNALLTEDVLLKLEQNKFVVYINNLVPPNDGGISLGQLYIASKTEEEI